MRSRLVTATLLLSMLVPASAQARFMGVYDYPFVSALVATVAATPPPHQAPMASEARLAEAGETRYLEVFSDRPVPDVFWYYGRGMPYAVFRQPDGRAPVFFIIGGTGAGYDAAKSHVLARVLFQVGFHVVSLPNPTHSSFVVTASEGGVPGQLREDGEDLYRVMRLIADELEAELDIRGYYLGGYSLGGAHAAFVSQIDDEQRRFGFKKALVINPPVSLYSSVTILDRMLDRHLNRDPAEVNAVVDRIFGELSEFYDTRQQIDYSDPDLIYRAYTFLEPPERELEMLIGLAFRLTSNDMSFASDVMTNAGYVVPKDAQLTATTSLTDVFLQGMGLTYVDYFDDVYVPQVRRRHPGMTREELIERASLRSIESYLRATDRLVLVGTEDDVILAPGEIEWLEAVFGERSRIFPTGGHCGSMAQREFVASMLELLAD